MLDNYVLAGNQKRCLGCMEPYDRSYDVCPHCGYTEEQTGISLLHLSPGTILAGRYLIGRTLGYGGFGVTYIAFDNMLQRKVAIKEYLPSEYATRNYQDPNVVVENNEKRAQQFKAGKDRFLEEGKRLAEVGNIDNVVHMYDCFEANSTAYIVMELLEGMTLAEYLDSKGAVSQEEMLDIMLPLMGSLSQVHEIGIIHRDISPENIFLTKDTDDRTVAKLIDFGSAKYAVVARSSKSLTVLVNKGYSPEEQYRSKGSQGTYTDVYALSAVMYRMLTGIIPPDALERRAGIETRKRDRLQPISKYNKNVSENIENAILNGMNVKVEDRSATVEELVGELISYERVKRRGTTIGFLDPLSWPLWARITVPLAALFAVVILVYSVNRIFTNPNFMVSLPDGMTRVPEFISSPFSDAVSKGEKAFLQVKSVSDEYTPGGKSDIVLTQDLAYGLVVRENSLVSVTVSTGKQYYNLPDVTGFDAEYARYALECIGLEVTVKDGSQAGLADNVVISQSIEPYTEVDSAASIVLTVNRTAETGKAVQDYSPAGSLYNDVIKEAALKGIQCRIADKVFSDKYQEYEVIESSYSEDGVLELTVGIPVREFKMPNLNYKNQDIAVQLLKNIGIEGKAEIDYNDAVGENLVYDQDVEKGRAVKPNTQVVLQVSRGGKPFTMPALIGMNREEAEKQLSGLKLAVKIEHGYSSEFKEGEVYQQSADAGSDVRRGDEITIYVCSTEDLIKVAGVVGRDQTDARSTLEGQKLKVQTVETYDDTVEKGRVISQLPEADTFQTEGTTIVLTVSKGSNKTAEKTKENTNAGPWSGWVSSLPAGVDKNSYDIEQGVQYRSRKRETTTSTQPSMSGWTLYDQTEAWSDYGKWSDWSTNRPESSETTKVQSKTQYSISTRSTTTSTTSNTMSGWTLYDTRQGWSEYGAWSSWSTTQPTADEYTKSESKKQYRSRTKNRTSSREAEMNGWTLENTSEEWGDYGSWSAWSTTQVSSNESTDVETKTQYRYQDKNYTTSTNSSMSGWTLEGQEYEYGEWSSWNYVLGGYNSNDNNLEVEQELVSQDCSYGYWVCKSCHYIYPKKNMQHNPCPECNSTSGVFAQTFYNDFYDVGTDPDYVEVDGKTYYRISRGAVKRYRYRTRSKTLVYKFSRWGDWSSWQDDSVSASSSRNVETQTVYRYRTRSKVKVYNYWQWGNWSDWQDSEITSNSDRDVQTQSVYRYAKRQKQYTYCFEKWSEWSSWSDTSYAESSEQKVKTRTVFCYATRNKQYTYYFERWGAWSDYGNTPIASSSNVDVQTRVVYRYRRKA